MKNNLFSLLSSRPGRPPKRGVPFPPMSPQDAMMHLKNMQNGASVAAAAAAGVTDPYKDGPFPKGKSPFYINPSGTKMFLTILVQKVIPKSIQLILQLLLSCWKFIAKAAVDGATSRKLESLIEGAFSKKALMKAKWQIAKYL